MTNTQKFTASISEATEPTIEHEIVSWNNGEPEYDYTQAREVWYDLVEVFCDGGMYGSTTIEQSDSPEPYNEAVLHVIGTGKSFSWV